MFHSGEQIALMVKHAAYNLYNYYIIYIVQDSTAID